MNTFKLMLVIALLAILPQPVQSDAQNSRWFYSDVDGEIGECKQTALNYPEFVAEVIYQYGDEFSCLDASIYADTNAVICVGRPGTEVAGARITTYWFATYGQCAIAN